jgi:hypothetical protein
VPRWAIKGTGQDAETGEVRSVDHGDAMTGSITTRLRVSLVAQALVTGGLAAGPMTPGRWLPFVVGVAAGALLLAWFVGTGTRSAWTMTLGFEALALVVGGTGAAAGHWIPGTLFGIVVAVQLVLGRAAFPATAKASAGPVRLTPPAVVAAVQQPVLPPPPPAFPPPGAVPAAALPTSRPPTLPPAPPQAPPLRQPVGNILPNR